MERCKLNGKFKSLEAATGGTAGSWMVMVRCPSDESLLKFFQQLDFRHRLPDR